MFSKVDYVMVFVSDMHRSVEFYRDTLGLRLKFESPGWSEFDTGTTTLALHPERPAPANAAGSQSGPTAGTCSIGFSVPDLNRTYTELSARGVHFLMPPTVRPNEGIKLAVCIDPDGLGISLAENIAREAETP